MHDDPASIDLDLTALELDEPVRRAAFPDTAGGAAVVAFRAFLRAHGAPERLNADEAADRFCRVLICPESEPALARAVHARLSGLLSSPVALRSRYAQQITAELQRDQLRELERIAAGVTITIAQ